MGFGQLWLATPLHQGVMLAPLQDCVARTTTPQLQSYDIPTEESI